MNERKAMEIEVVEGEGSSQRKNEAEDSRRLPTAIDSASVLAEFFSGRSATASASRIGKGSPRSRLPLLSIRFPALCETSQFPGSALQCRVASRLEVFP